MMPKYRAWLLKKIQKRLVMAGQRPFTVSSSARWWDQRPDLLAQNLFTARSYVRLDTSLREVACSRRIDEEKAAPQFSAAAATCFHCPDTAEGMAVHPRLFERQTRVPAVETQQARSVRQRHNDELVVDIDTALLHGAAAVRAGLAGALHRLFPQSDTDQLA